MASFCSGLQRRRRSWPKSSPLLSLLLVINITVCLSLIVRGKRCPVFHGARSKIYSATPVLRRPVESIQYISIRYTERLAEAGIEPSVGSKGDSYDNALAETVNGLYKAELIYRQSWKSREAVEMATLKWVHWYNHQRLLSSIGYIPPAEAEANFYRQQTGQAMVA